MPSVDMHPVPAARATVLMAAKATAVEPVVQEDLFDDLVPATQPPAAGLGNDMVADPILLQLNIEIQLFKLEPTLGMYSDGDKTMYSNPLQWWKLASFKFPLLSRRAQKVLAVMGTSAPSERVFSSGGNIVTKNRASMHADTVANLILLKQSLLAAKAFELKKSQNAAKR